jgi:hypothetical protein
MAGAREHLDDAALRQAQVAPRGVAYLSSVVLNHGSTMASEPMRSNRAKHAANRLKSLSKNKSKKVILKAIIALNELQ